MVGTARQSPGPCRTFYTDRTWPSAGGPPIEEGTLYPTVTRVLLLVLVLWATAALLGGWAWDDHGGLP